MKEKMYIKILNLPFVLLKGWTEGRNSNRLKVKGKKKRKKNIRIWIWFLYLKKMDEEDEFKSIESKVKNDKNN